MGTAGSDRERRVVTVLFCDLVGSTAAADGVDPEDVHDALAAFHRAVRDRVLEFGGTVEKYVGDAVMAIFGVPTAHEDDAERAVRTGLALAGDAAAGLLPELRVGVNTGEVIVVIGARPELGEPTIIGDPVNTAARLQSVATTNSVLVGAMTHRATDRVFEYAPLPPAQVKGKSQPLEIWQPLAAKARFGADILRDLSTPMVGRDAELSTLVEAFRRAVRDGAELVTVIGEPGVGKSRLVAELLRSLDRGGEAVVWRQGRCPPYGAEVPFSALGDIVKAHLGIYDNDSADVVRGKLESGVPDEDAWLRTMLGPLVGLPGAGQVDQQQQFTAWTSYLETFADRGPVVLVVEDLHWADTGTLAFLSHLVGSVPTLPMLVLVTARPELLEEHPDWGTPAGGPRSVHLVPLGEDDTERLLAGIVGDLDFDVRTRTALVARSGGNPLYAEELARLLRDAPHDGSVDLDELPDTLHALIAARLDTLTGAQRGVLHDAAVIGKTFWSGAAAALTQRTEGEVERDLHELVRREFLRLLRRSSIVGQREYSFVHALIRDVAYQQLPRADRARRHLAAADWLAAIAPERVEDNADTLTHHALTAYDLASATRDEQLVEHSRSTAVGYGLLVIGQPLRLTNEQLAYLPERIAPLVDPGTVEEGRLLVARAWARGLMNDPEAEQIADRAIAVLRSLDRPLDLGRALRVASDVCGTFGRLDKAGGYVSEAVAVLEPSGPTPELARALSDLSGTAFDRDPAAGRAMARRAVDMVRGFPRLGYDEGGALWRVLGRLASLLDPDDPAALPMIDEAIEVAERWAPVATIRLVSTKVGLLMEQRGPLASIAEAEQALLLSRASAVKRTSMFLGMALLPCYLLAGRLHDASRTGHEVAAELERIGYLQSAHEMQAFAVPAELALGNDARLLPGWPEIAAEDRADLGPRAPGQAQLILGAAAQIAAAAGEPERARGLVRRAPACDGPMAPVAQLGALMRTAAALGADDDVRRLGAGLTGTTALRRAMLATGQALALEASDPRAAADAFRLALERHRDLGCRFEEAHALDGLARCLDAVGDPDAANMRRASADLFTAMTAAAGDVHRVSDEPSAHASA